MAPPGTPLLSQSSGKCICEICDCGRHHCPHLLTKPYVTDEKPCLLSEYTDKYLLYPNAPPRESFKPKSEYNKQPVPMEGISTARRDYVPYEVRPIKQRPPDKYVKKDETMDLLSTYRKDYNPHPLTRVLPFIPQAQHISSGEMTTIPTYKCDYVPWNQPKRDMIKPDNAYRPSDDKFDHRTTNQDDYLYKGPVITKSFKPFKTPQITNIPLDSTTNYKLNYVSHPIQKRYVHEPEPFKPSDLPFEGLTTHKLSYKGLSGEPAKSMKQPYIRPDAGMFVGSTEFKEKYQAWPTPARFIRNRDVYTPPKEKMNLQTTAQTHYGHPHGRPATSCKPMVHIAQHTEPFAHRSTTKEDYQPWQSVRPAPVVPHSEITLPAVPMETLTTFQEHYVPHPLPFTKSFKPHRPAARPDVPLKHETTYTTSYTPKEIHICPASFKEPPGYVFDKIDEGGHKRFRPATMAQARRSSNSNVASRKGSPTGGRPSQTAFNAIPLKA